MHLLTFTLLLVLVSCNQEPAVTLDVKYKEAIPLKVTVTGLEGAAEVTLQNSKGETESAQVGTSQLTIKDTDANAVAIQSEAPGFDCLLDSSAEVGSFIEVTISCAKVGPKVQLIESVGLFVSGNIAVIARIDLPSSAFDAADINCNNCTIANFTNSGDDQEFTFDVVPTSEGGVNVQVFENTFIDDTYSVLNVNASNEIAVTYDGTPPSATLVSGVDGGTFASPTFNVAIGLNENVEGFAIDDFECTNCTVTELTGFGTNWTAKIDPTNTGAVSVYLKAGGIRDIAGNTNAQSNTISTTYTAVIPTCVLATAAGAGVNLPFAVTATFSENMNGFDATDITCNNCTVSAFTGSGSSYGFTVNPNTQGAVTVVVGDSKAVGAVSLAGNSPSNILSTIYDIIDPIATITTTASDPTSLNPIPITITFSEDVFNFIAGDLTVSNASVTNFSQVDGQTFTADLVPPASAVISVNLIAGKVDDIAGNKNPTATPLTINYSNPADDCTGTFHDGYCWFFQSNTNCDTVCATQGGVHNATRYYAGSHGTRQQCDDVLNAIGNPAINFTPLADMYDFANSTGCFLDSTDFSFVAKRPTATNVTVKYPICACKTGSVDLQVPEEITNLTAVASSTNTIELSWESGGGHSYDYLIAYSTGASAPPDCSSPQVLNSAVERVTESGVKHVLVGLTAATTYKIRVCASNGESGFSAGAVVTSTTATVDAVAQATRPLYDKSTDYSASSSTAHSFLHTMTVNNNRLLIVTIRGNDISADNLAPTSVTYDSVAMTKLVDIDNTNNKAEVEVYYLVNPSTGGNLVEISYGAATTAEIVATSFYNVNQTTPIGTVYSRSTVNTLDSHRLIVSQAADQSDRIMGIVASASSGQSHSTFSPNGVLTANNSTDFGEEFRIVYFGGEAMYHFTSEVWTEDYAIIMLPIKAL
jgi:hypothetical protein